MVKVLAHIPLYVWPLLTLLLASGLRALKKNTVPLAVLLVLPAGFLIWSLFTFFGRFGEHIPSVVLWVVCLISGISLGYLHVLNLHLEFIKERKMVVMPGSALPLALSLSIFSAKFSIGVVSGMFPHLSTSLLILGLELVAALILGVFAGRAMGCLKRMNQTIT